MSCCHEIFLLLIDNEEVSLFNPKVKVQLQISYWGDGIVIEVHTRDKQAKLCFFLHEVWLSGGFGSFEKYSKEF